MTKIKSKGFIALGCAALAALAVGAVVASPVGAEAIQVKSTFYVIQDFYEVNWKRNWWDLPDSGIAGAAGSVTYSDRADSMTVAYTGNYNGNNIMWGADNQIKRAERDFSAGTFYANEVKNAGAQAARYQLIISNSSAEADNHYPLAGYPYYLVSQDGAVTQGKIDSDRFLPVPVGFEGLLLVPMNSYSSECDRGQVARYSFGFPRGEAGAIKFGRCGYIDNDAVLTGSSVIVSDPTVYYELPERIVLQKAPARKITEPETALENNVAK